MGGMDGKLDDDNELDTVIPKEEEDARLDSDDIDGRLGCWEAMAGGGRLSEIGSVLIDDNESERTSSGPWDRRKRGSICDIEGMEHARGSAD